MTGEIGPFLQSIAAIRIIHTVLNFSGCKIERGGLAREDIYGWIVLETR